MFEVEAKVPISQAEYKKLREKLGVVATYMGKRRNIDSYYGKLQNATMRIRKRGSGFTFDLKNRRISSGIESNTEMEWKLKDPDGWRKLLRRLCIQPGIRKTKKTELYQMKGFLIELNEIPKLGYYLEIERIVDNEDLIKQAKKQLIELFKELGYKRSQFEPRRYLELLKHV